MKDEPYRRDERDAQMVDYQIKPCSVGNPSWKDVVLRATGEHMGRLWREDKTWAARYYHNGGGSSQGPFRTRKLAAEWILQKNATLTPLDKER